MAQNSTKQKTGTAADRAYMELRKQILNGALEEGLPIRQDEIATQLGVSKIPVREALMRLQTEGLVVFTQNAGATVAVLTVDDYVEMLDLRLAIECRALELAVPNMTLSDLAQARELLDAYQQVNNAEQWSELNAQFHDCLYAPSNRPRLLTMIKSVRDHMGKLMRRRVTEAAGHERSYQEHLKILAACEEGSASRAVTLLRKHIEHTQREVKASFRQV